MDAAGFRRFLWALWPDTDLTHLSLIETGWDSRVAEVNALFPVERAVSLGAPGGDDASRSVLLSDCRDFRHRVLPPLEGDDADRAARFLDDIVGGDRTFDFEPSLVHADLGPDHILCSRGEISGVIDWGDVRIGDPAIDFGWLADNLPLKVTE